MNAGTSERLPCGGNVGNESYKGRQDRSHGIPISGRTRVFTSVKKYPRIFDAWRRSTLILLNESLCRSTSVCWYTAMTDELTIMRHLSLISDGGTPSSSRVSAKTVDHGEWYYYLRLLARCEACPVSHDGLEKL